MRDRRYGMALLSISRAWRGVHVTIVSELSYIACKGAMRGAGVLSPRQKICSRERDTPISGIAQFMGSCFPGRISRREGFYAPPVCHDMTEIAQVYLVHRHLSVCTCVDGGGMARRRGVKPLPTRDSLRLFSLEPIFCRGERDGG